MSIIIEIPESIASKIAELGLDIEREIIEYIIRKLNLDPNTEAKIHMDLAKRFLSEGKKIVEKDPIQAAEKLYKATEEAIKALTIALNIDEILSKVSNQGRWTITDLEKAVRILKKRIGKVVMEAWDSAWYLHILGFHEAKLDSEGVEERMDTIETLIEISQKELAKHLS